MNEFTFVDVNGLGGGLSLGLSQAGGELLWRTGSLALGQKMVWANRALFNESWDDVIDKKADGAPEKWETFYLKPGELDLVAAVPPCSGFSGLTGMGAAMGKTEKANADHKSNGCMIDTIAYAGRLAPRMVAFESVTGAYKQGRPLMQRLRADLEKATGHEYFLTHVLHNGLALGAPANRKRYLFVATRGRPFALTHEPLVTQVTTVGDAIADLELQVPIAGWQQYRQSATSDYALRLRGHGEGTDGCWHRRSTGWQKATLGTLAACDRAGIEWRQGEYMKDVLARLHTEDLKAVQGVHSGLVDMALPQQGMADRLRGREFNMGAFDIVRWNYAKTGRVVTGGGPMYTVHPVMDRNLHYRELARVMGYPDAWTIDGPEVAGEKLDAVWGKNVHVAVGRWFGQNVAAWMQETEGREGELVGDREYLIDDLDHGRRLMRELAASFKEG